MRFSFLTVMAVLTPAAAFAPRSVSTAFVTAPSSVSRTELSMAFEGTQQTSNMFEGPGPLVRERDACGVGFIANTKSGGTFISLLLLLPTCRILLSQNIPMVSRFTRISISLTLLLRPQRFTTRRRVWYAQGPSRRNRCTHLHGAPWCLRR